jgi:hypothetical protein
VHEAAHGAPEGRARTPVTAGRGHDGVLGTHAKDAGAPRGPLARGVGRVTRRARGSEQVQGALVATAVRLLRAAGHAAGQTLAQVGPNPPPLDVSS